MRLIAAPGELRGKKMGEARLFRKRRRQGGFDKWQWTRFRTRKDIDCGTNEESERDHGRNRIAIANLKRAGNRRKIHNLITGRKNRDARPVCDDWIRRSNLGCRGDFRKSDSSTG